MNKQDLKELARYGAERKLSHIEEDLKELHREFPDIFASGPPFVLLKAEQRKAAKDWPIVANGKVGRKKGYNGDWTPERRAQQAEIMKARQVKMHRARWPKGTKKRRTPKKTPKQGWVLRWKQRLSEHGPERLFVTAAALGTQSANLVTSGRQAIADGEIVKQSDGSYALPE
jgi:hypothetical protein